MPLLSPHLRKETNLISDYSGLSLLAIAGKILARIVGCRLGHLTESFLRELQCGSRPNRGIVNMLFFTGRQLQEKCHAQHRDLYMGLINLKSNMT